MKIVAQSQTPTKVGYIHLAYISVALSNGISKGELLPVQMVLGIGVAAALACAALGLKLRRKARPMRAAMGGAVLGIAAMLVFYKTAEALWTSTLSNEQVVKHVIESDQWWALREGPIAAGIESAASTNSKAASMASRYYTLQQHQNTNAAATYLVKSYYYAQLASTNGVKQGWASRVDDLENIYGAERLQVPFQEAIEKRMLNPAEQQWATERLAKLKAIASSPP